MASGSGLTAALKHRDYRYLISAFTLSDTGSWAYNVALTVWVFEATGSVAWIAAATVCRFVPALVLSAYAGVVAERYDKAHFLRVIDLLSVAVMAALALVMTFDGPVVAVLVVAAIASTLGTAYDPAAAALTPHVVPAADLASANALRNTIDNVTVIAGPALGALLLLAGPPQNAVWINAGAFLLSAVLISRVRTRTEAVDVTEGGELGALAQMTTGIRTILSVPATAVMVAYSVLATLAFGVDTVLFVAASDQILGTGPDGYGYLLAGLGIGGVLAAPLVTRAEARPALGPIILAGMALYCLPTLVLLVSDEPAVAFVAQVVRGAATLFVDVLAVTALQRTLPGDVLARVFGAFNTLMIGAILIGSLVTSWVIEGLGVDAAIWVAGAGLFAVSLLGWPWLQQMDREAAARRARLGGRIELLTGCDLFEQVADGDLTQLAAQAEPVDVPAGAVVVAEGEPADAFYVVASGRMAVTSASGVDVPDLDVGDYFGEIGLLERIPRTATVTAVGPASLLRIDGAAFLEALTADKPSVALLDGAALRLRRTHPTLALSSTGLAPEQKESP